jgi:predicted small secreted protein
MDASIRPQSLRYLLLAPLFIGAALMLGACNTVAGMGSDLAAAGRAIERTADNAKR